MSQPVFVRRGKCRDILDKFVADNIIKIKILSKQNLIVLLVVLKEPALTSKNNVMQ